MRTPAGGLRTLNSWIVSRNVVSDVLKPDSVVDVMPEVIDCPDIEAIRTHLSSSSVSCLSEPTGSLPASTRAGPKV